MITKFKTKIIEYIFIIFILASGNNVLANSNIIVNPNSRLNCQDWNKLIEYSLNYVKNNKNDLSIFINESGFYRVNVKNTEEFARKLGITKIRLNYWPEDSSISVKEESIHNHPNYFESYIIDGGYKHTIYILNDNIDKSAKSNILNSYKIKKVKHNLKNFVYKGRAVISKAIDEKVKRGGIVIMPTNIIHRILYAVPGSITLNVLFNDAKDNNSYNVYLTNNANEKDIVTERNQISDLIRKKLIEEIGSRIESLIFQIN